MGSVRFKGKGRTTFSTNAVPGSTKYVVTGTCFYLTKSQ